MGVKQGLREAAIQGIWLFALAARAGFLLESLESWLSLGYVQNRQGLLFGPFTPVYGAGAVCFALCRPLLGRGSWPRAFWVCFFTGSVVEFVWSWCQEALFATRWWDYGHLPFQLGGRVSLLFALCWGVLGALFLQGVEPWLRRALRPSLGRDLVAAALFLLLAGDVLFSGAVFYRQAQRARDIPPANPVWAYLDRHFSDQALQAQFPVMRLLPLEE